MVDVRGSMRYSVDLKILSNAAGRSLPSDTATLGVLANSVLQATENLTSLAPISIQQLGAAIRAHLPENETLDAITTWHLDELFIAYSAVAGVPKAVRIIETMIGNTAGAALGSRGYTPAEIEEVVQQQLTTLLVGEKPKLALYSGRGSLGGFLRSAIIRSALNARRDEATRHRYAFAQRLEDVLDEPELRHLKENYLLRFRKALGSAMADLDAEKKLALRLQLEDGLTIDELGRLWGVHRATAARRLVTAREALASATRTLLQNELALSDSDLESVMNLIRSRLGDATSALS